MEDAKVIPARFWQHKKTGKIASIYGAGPLNATVDYDLVWIGYTVSYPDGDIGHNCTIGMSESAAQAVADKYNALMRGIADSHSARMKMLEDIKSTLPLADIECARTYANHWQWRSAAHGYPDYMGYAKSKKAALQAAIHSIATDIVDNKYRKES